MSQICPSPSSQLAAAAVAFRRARQKFPKNIGVCACSGDAPRNSLHAYPPGNPTVAHSISSNRRGRENDTCLPSLPSPRTESWPNACCKGRRVQVTESINHRRSGGACVACRKKHSCSQARIVRVDEDSCKGQLEREPKIGDIINNSKTSASTCGDVSCRVTTSVQGIESKEHTQRIQSMIHKPVSDQESHETVASKSTHSCTGWKKWKYVRHKRSCIHAGKVRIPGSQSPPKINGCSNYHLHGYRSVHRRRSSVPQKPQNVKYYNRKLLGGRSDRSEGEVEEVSCCDSPTLIDFPTKLQTWEQRTQQGSYRRGIPSHQSTGMKKTCVKNPTSKLLKARQMTCKSRSPQSEESTSITSTRNQLEQTPSLDVCLRPSLIKAAQRKQELNVRVGGKSYQKNGIIKSSCRSNNLNVKSTWDENLNIIKHKDSMSILMDKFRGNNNLHRNQKLQNIYELNSILGSKTSCGVEEPLQSSDMMFQKTNQETDSITNKSLPRFEDAEPTEHFSHKKITAASNPVTKLGRIANQALRENDTHLKNPRTHLNRTGICCSLKGSPLRRVF